MSDDLEEWNDALRGRFRRRFWDVVARGHGLAMVSIATVLIVGVSIAMFVLKVAIAVEIYRWFVG